MFTDLQVLAINAVADEDPDDPIAVIRAAGNVRTAAGCDLRTARNVVVWAMARTEQPTAAGLPAESVVAAVTLTAIKKHPADLPAVGGCPWAASNGGVLTDSQIDALLQDGSAEVLRVGDGRAER